MLNIFSSKRIARFSLPLLLAASVAMLTGCGGGGAAAGTAAAASGVGATTTAATASGASGVGATTTAATTTAATVQLLVSSPQINSSGATSVGLTAIVLSASGQVVPGRTVVFSKGTDPTAYINNVSASGVSDANGLVTAQLNIGSSKANRTIAISATVDGVVATNSVSVIGTTIAFSGNNSMAFGATTTLTISVKDSAGNAVPSVAVTTASLTGNTIVMTPASGITDATGSITAAVTASKPGNDVITATAAGTSKSQNLTISSASFGFTAPVSMLINVNTPTALSVLWSSAGVPVVASAVTFTASRGTITGSPVITNVGGTATASISSASSGPSIITATGPGGTPSATINVNFTATTASTITSQVNPSTIQPSTGAAGQTSNISTISAVVRDAANNLVQNARVNFSIIVDPTAGGLSAATAVTDASGTASVTYISGAISSPQNGVTIRVTAVDINGVPIAPVLTAVPDVSLTVGGTALFVRLGTDNLVASAPPNNTKTYSALVTDSAGNPVPAGTQVRFVVRPSRYLKGSYSLPCVGIPCAPTAPWIQFAAATCGNEDVNFNGFIGPVTVSAAPNPGTGMTVATPLPLGTSILTNDYNVNGRLDPGNVASVNATATTDANGFALANISYAKNYATWVEVVLEARAGTVGNDPPAVVTFTLPGIVLDYSSVIIAPPGQFSPFGLVAGCNNSL